MVCASIHVASKKGGSKHLQSCRDSYIKSALQNRVSQSIILLAPHTVLLFVWPLSYGGGGFIDKGWVLSLISKPCFLLLPLAKDNPCDTLEQSTAPQAHSMGSWMGHRPLRLEETEMTTDGMGKRHNKEEVLRLRIRGTTGSTAPASERKGIRVFMETQCLSFVSLAGMHGVDAYLNDRPRKALTTAYRLA